jgi:hypothetical protein
MSNSYRYTIATGNPRIGYTLLGVFETVEDAYAYGQTSNFVGDWTVMQIQEA